MAWIIQINRMKNKGLAIRPFIFVGDKGYQCLIEHEQKHIEQQKYFFPFNIIWLLRWFFSYRFRHRTEKEAFRVQLKCLIKKGVKPSRSFFYNMLVNRENIFSYKMPPDEVNALLDEEGIK